MPVTERLVLVCAEAFGTELPAGRVAGALARGIEAAGLLPPDELPLSAGGPGTLGVLLPRLGGELVGVAGIDPPGAVALLDDGIGAVIEAAPSPDGSSTRTGALAAAALDAGAGALILCGDPACTDDGAGARSALGDRRARTAFSLVGDSPVAAALGARPEPGLRWVLDALDGQERLLASRCVVIAVARLDDAGLRTGVAGEVGTRARQGGVPAHAVTADDALDPFGRRIIDLMVVQEAATTDALHAAGDHLGALLRDGRA